MQVVCRAEHSDKTLKELYLPSFAESVRAGTGAVMWWVDVLVQALTSSSYNKINGTASCQNADSMNRILKGELGFQGL